MRYSLTRERDGAGDSGPMSMLLHKKGSEPDDGVRPKVGFGIAVGSPYARTYQAQDYWQTTEILEILEETENEVRFRTRNSIYVWRQF
jgi:hypothetical protein